MGCFVVVGYLILSVWGLVLLAWYSEALRVAISEAQAMTVQAADDAPTNEGAVP